MRGRLLVLRHFIAVLLVLSLPSICLSAEVSKETAQQVAEKFMQHHVATHGDWAGTTNPFVTDVEEVKYENAPLAYNVKVSPAGHLLIPSHDEFSPVLLYSTTSDFIPTRINEKHSIESWIIPEISLIYKKISQTVVASAQAANLGVVPSVQAADFGETKVAKAWRWLKGTPPSSVDAGSSTGAATLATPLAVTVVAPLLSVAWDQPSPFNNYTPNYSCSQTGNGRAYTGCVATAMAQLMKYWNWPDSGVGSHSYAWSGSTLSADFNHSYYWSDMPNTLTNSSSIIQKDAVARLMSDAGIAVDMQYGCDGSSAYTNKIAPALTNYFKYKNSIIQYDRSNYSDNTSWFNLFTTELNAVPPRPILFNIQTPDGINGHEVVVDGYQTDITSKVHVNLGWGGSYTGWYDITHDFTTDAYTWSGTTQWILTNIQPGNGYATPDFTISASPSSLSATQGASVATAISTTVTGGFNNAVSLSATGLPTGATASFNTMTISAPGSGSATLTLTAGASTPTSTYTVTITGTGGGKTHTATISYMVTPPSTPDFTISASPSSLSATQGGSALAAISTTVTGGFNAAVTLTASGVPTGATATFSPASIAAPGSGSANLTLTIGGSTPTGTYTVTITGTGGGKTHTATISFTVGSTTTLFSDGFEAGGWSTAEVSGTAGLWTTVGAGAHPIVLPHGGAMLADFNSWTADSGNQTRLYRTSSIAIPGTIASATLSFWMYHDTGDTSWPNLNDQVQVQVSTNGTSWTNLGTPVNRYDGTTGWTQVSIDVSAYKNQTLWLGFVGISAYGNDIYLDDVAVTAQGAVSADFTLAAPSAVTAVQGGSGTAAISTTVTGGFTAAVALTASGVPTGATAAFSPPSIAAPGSGSATLTLTAGASTPIGTYSVTVTGTGGSKTHTATISFMVTAVPDFTLAAPTAVTATQGGAGAATISTTVAGSFNAAVALTASGVPTGATAAFSPASIAAPGSGSTTLTLTTGASTPMGTYSVTVTGTGGGKTHTATISFTVAATAICDGDVDGKGTVDIADALLALKIAVNLHTPTSGELAHGDVAPFANNMPAPDGKINISDALMILKKVVKLVNW